jgi:hypothetical protein
VLDDGRTGGDIAEVLLDALLDVVGVDVTSNDEDGVGGTVVGLEPFLHVVERGSAQVFHRSDH